MDIKFLGLDGISRFLQKLKTLFAQIGHTHLKSEITDFPTIPTKTSQLTNDSGFKTTDSDTKNTAGSTDSSNKLFIIGATSQAANPQTYSHDTAYVGTDGCLYSGSTKVSVDGHTHSGYAKESHSHNDATTTSSGFLSPADKSKLNGITESADSVSFSRSLTSGTKIGTITINDGSTDIYAPTNTDTHYVSGTVVCSSATASSNTSSSLANGSVYLNHVENGSVKNSHKISGSGATTVTSDASGNIVITSTDNNTTYGVATSSSPGLVKSGTDITVDSSGNVSVNDDSHNHVISNIDNLQTSLDAKQATITGGATTIASSNLTASRALISNSSGKVAVSDVTSTELGYLDGVTSNIQTQLSGKASSTHSHSATDITSGTFSSDRLPTVPLAKGGTGATTAAAALTNLGLTATAAELNYCDGVTSNIQTQLNSKMPSAVSNFEMNSNGSLKNYGGFIDFHYHNSDGNPTDSSGTVVDSTPDYTSRIIEDSAGTISVNNVKMKGGTITGTLSGNATTATTATKLGTNAGDSNTPVYFSNGIPVACTSLDLNTTGNATTATTATTATKLSNTSAIGSATKPVYFSASGVPVAGTYTLGSACAKTAGSASGNVPLNGSALGTTANVPVVTNTSGNLIPHASGALGTAAFTASSAYATSGHTHSNYASTISTSGSGNAVTAISQSGNTITVTKGTTFATPPTVSTSYTSAATLTDNYMYVISKGSTFTINASSSSFKYGAHFIVTTTGAFALKVTNATSIYDPDDWVGTACTSGAIFEVSIFRGHVIIKKTHEA